MMANKNMIFRKVFVAAMIIFATGPLMAQKVNYKSGLLRVDEKDVAKIVRIKDKETFGLTASYEVYSLSGEKLILATVANGFVPNQNDNSTYYYQVSFLTLDKVGIFSLSMLGPEKSFAKLIGESGIVVEDKLDPKMVTELIARKSQSPQVVIEYHLVRRDKRDIALIKENEIYQGNMLIGRFKDISRRKEFDIYEFSLPDGLVIGTVSFTGGNGAQNCTVSTNKDRRTQNAAIPSKGVYGALTARSEGMDRNAIVLRQIATWLIRNNYL